MKKWHSENNIKNHGDFFADGYSHAMFTVCKHARQLMMDAKHAEDEGDAEKSRALYTKAWAFIEILTHPKDHPYPMAYFLRARFHEFGYGDQEINLQMAKLYYTYASGNPNFHKPPTTSPTVLSQMTRVWKPPTKVWSLPVPLHKCSWTVLIIR